MSIPVRPRMRLASVLCTLLVVAVTSIGLQPSEAYVLRGLRGTPGAVRTVYVVQATHDLGLGTPLVALLQRGPRVGRSAAFGGIQRVRATYVLQRWTGQRWIRQATQQNMVQLPPGGGVRELPGPGFYPTSGIGYYRMQIHLRWVRNDSGATLGQRTIAMVNRGDYRCQTAGRCQVGPGWVYLGRY